MGYTTDFEGSVEVTPPLNDAERTFLAKFADTRRVNRKNGPYYVDGSGFKGQGSDEDVIDHNSPPPEQPGLWCQWVPTEDGSEIEWDQGEKFYDAAEWMAYLIDTFLKPGCTVEKQIAVGDQAAADIAGQFNGFTFDHTVEGTIHAQGEDPEDRWQLKVTDNEVETLTAAEQYVAEGQLPDSEALDQLATFLYADPDNFPGGADTCERLDQVLTSTGRGPKARS